MGRRKKLKTNKKITVEKPSKNLNYPRLFLLIGGFFGLAMLLITPPFQVPDEHDHFFRAVMIASGQFVTRKYPFRKTEKAKVPLKYLQGSGGIVPISVPYTTRMVNHKLPFHPENKQRFTDIKKMLSLPLKMPGQPDVFINTSAGGYAPLLYLPAALIITIGKSLALSPLWLMYLGRLANLLVYLSLIYGAIKITPTGKPLFLLLALMPMSLFLAPSLSIDGIIIAASMLLTAELLNLAYHDQQPVKRRTWFIIPSTLTLLALGKIVYCPLILLLFLSPKVLIGQERSRLYLFISSLALAGTSYLLWHWLKGMTGTPPEVTNIPFDFTSFQAKDELLPLLDSQKQLQFLQNYPGSIFTILNHTIQEQGQHYIESFIGLLGWLDTKLPTWVYISYPFALIAGAISCQPTSHRPLTEKTLLTLLWATCSGAILLGFYLFSTPVGNAIIGGIQGRYFIPIALPFLFIFSISYRSPIITKNPLPVCLAPNWPVLYSGIVLFTTTFSLWGRYY